MEMNIDDDDNVCHNDDRYHDEDGCGGGERRILSKLTSRATVTEIDILVDFHAGMFAGCK